jgi:hypothetical protein
MRQGPKEVTTTMSAINRRGQSVAEYAILLGLVIAAFVTMQVYARRGLQARVKSGTDALTGLSQTITADGLSATFKSQSQYEPYYAESQYETYQESVEQEHMGSGKIVREKVSDVTARKAGGYQKQRGTGDRATRDAMWDETAP